MSSDEIQRRVSAALDTPEGLDGDPELSAMVAKDPLLQLFVTESKKLDGLLRSWRIDELSDAEMEAMAAAVEARLDDALPAIGDVTRAPQFDDDDARRDPSGQTRVSDPGKPAFTIDRLSELESTEELSIPHLPPPPPSNVVPLGAPKSARKDERVEIPTVKPLLQPFASFDPTALPPPEKRSKTGWIVGGSLLAAAAVLVVFGVQMMNSGSDGEDAVVVASRETAGGPDYAQRSENSRSDTHAPEGTPASPASPASSAQPPVVQQEPSNGAEAAPGSGDPSTRTTTMFATDSVASGEAGLRRESEDRAAAVGVRGAMQDNSLDGLAEVDERAPRDVTNRPSPPAEAPSLAAATPAAPTPTPMATASAGAARAGGGTPSASGRRAPAQQAPRHAVAGDAPSASGRATPEQSEVRSALESVRPAVTACAAGRRGVANIRVTFSGTSGRVSTVNVEGTFAGTPEGSCMARAVRAAHVGRFGDPTLVVLYPYAL